MVQSATWSNGLLAHPRNERLWSIQQVPLSYEASQSAECSNCNVRERDDDTWLTLFECLAFLKIKVKQYKKPYERSEKSHCYSLTWSLRYYTAPEVGTWLPLSSQHCATRWKQHGRGKGGNQPNTGPRHPCRSYQLFFIWSWRQPGAVSSNQP